MNALHHLLSLRAALWGLAIVLALFGAGNAFVALFAPARFEITYQFSVTVSYCPDEHCAFSGMMELANSGRASQDEVLITLAGLPGTLGGSPRVLNLDASQPRSGDPEITQVRQGNNLVIRVRHLTPGALVQLHFAGMVLQNDIERAMQPQLDIQSRGRQVEGDPRALAFGRWFTLSPVAMHPFT